MRTVNRGNAKNTAKSKGELAAVLGVLAAAGVGPVLPFPLLCAASKRLGGSGSRVSIHDALQQLEGLVVRGEAGTARERAGLFHQTFAEYLLDAGTGEYGINAKQAHRALARSIQELAPMKRHDPDDILHAYARAAEPEHLWRAGRRQRAWQSMRARTPVGFPERVSWWKGFEKLVLSDPKPGEHALAVRANVAWVLGKAGHLDEAERLFQDLVPELERERGADDPFVLSWRHWRAEFLTWSGNAAAAVPLFEELAGDLARIHGPEHPETLYEKRYLARAIGATGRRQEALDLLHQVLPQLEEVDGLDHVRPLEVRVEIGGLLAEEGELEAALAWEQKLLPDYQRVLGKDIACALQTEQRIVRLTAQLGDTETALALWEELVPDCERALGRHA